jgi:hypothetical protein
MVAAASPAECFMAEFPLSLSRFLALPGVAGSAVMQFAKLLQLFHGNEKHTEAEWFAVLAAAKARPLTATPLRAPGATLPRVARRR